MTMLPPPPPPPPTTSPRPIDPDPSAAEAWEDDVDEWIPLVPTTGTAAAATANTTTTTTTTTIPSTRSMQENVAEVLQAVDDLLLVTADQDYETVSTTSSADNSNNNNNNSDGNANNVTTATTTTATTRERSITNHNKQQQQQNQEQPPFNRHGVTESPLKLRRRLRAARQKLGQSVARPVLHSTRRLVTGHAERRVRDHVVQPHIVRVLDKYLFTGGILGMLGTEFVCCQYPAYFRYWYCAVMVPLLALRVVLFARTKQHLFLLDYCYWVNGLGFLMALCPKRYLSYNNDDDGCLYDILWQVFFVSANGPLFFAMVAWNNSLVFHSVDKLTSTAVHILPALLSVCERWRSNLALNDAHHDRYITDDPILSLSSSSSSSSWLPLSRHLGYPLLFYLTWQTVYLIQTEWYLRDTLDADPELSTSLRYLTTAEKMSIHQQTLRLCRSVGVMGRGETFYPPTVKVKCIFVILQACMTVVTFLPVTLFYRYRTVHYVVVSAIVTFSVYNGARYYVQVFSRIYEKRYKDEDVPDDDGEYVDTSAVMTEHYNVKKDS